MVPGQVISIIEKNQQGVRRAAHGQLSAGPKVLAHPSTIISGFPSPNFGSPTAVNLRVVMIMVYQQHLGHSGPKRAVESPLGGQAFKLWQLTLIAD